MKKIALIAMSCTLIAFFSVTGCKKQEGQVPQQTQPGSSAPTTTPTGTGGM